MTDVPQTYIIDFEEQLSRIQGNNCGDRELSVVPGIEGIAFHHR